ncbi:MAG: hypothetical protein AAB490_06245 [Patescibacteria group bacterium]
MKTIEIRDSKDRRYTLKVNTDDIKKEVKDGQTSWEIEHEVWTDGEGRVGFGHFSASCTQEHDHLPDEKIIEALISLGREKVIADINNERDIESKGYNIHITDCTQ